MPTKILDYINLILIFVLVTTITPTVLFPLLLLLGIKLNLVINVLLLGVNAWAAYSIWKSNYFSFDWYFVGIILPICVLLYGWESSPAFDAMRFASAYLGKTYNLLNFGTIYRPMDWTMGLQHYESLEGINAVLSHANWSGDRLYWNFQYGPACSFYHIANFFPTAFTQLSPMLIAIGVAALLHQLFQLCIKKKLLICGILLLFLLSPVSWYFGRSSYAEFSMLLYLLASLLLVLKVQNKWSFYLLLPLLFGMPFVHYQLVFVLFLLPLMLAMIDHRKALIATTTGAVGYAVSTIASPYYTLVVDQSPAMHYAWIAFFCLIAVGFGWMIKQLQLRSEAQLTTLLVWISGTMVLLLLGSLFYDNLFELVYPVIDEETQISFFWTLLMNYADNMQIFGLVLPVWLIILGALAIPYSISKQELSLRMQIALCFFLLMSLVIFMQPSQQGILYDYSRHLLVYPCLGVLFGLTILLASFDDKMGQLVLLVLLIVGCNQYFGAWIRPEATALQTQLEEFELSTTDASLPLAYAVEEQADLFPMLMRWKGPLIPLMESNNDFCAYFEQASLMLSKHKLPFISTAAEKLVLNYSMARDLPSSNSKLPDKYMTVLNRLYFHRTHSENCNIYDKASYLCGKYYEREEAFMPIQILKKKMAKR